MNFENEKLILTDIEQEMKKSFMEYSMSVIVSRALPDVRDGLKPVHRRILYTLFEKNLTHDKPYHKAADTVGSVLGSYHPHGDMSVYDALVRMAQDFSLRYPLVDGHGNFGSIDGDPPAAYRYTEARMSRIAAEMLSDIGKETVDYAPNYDDRLLEPKVLPARFPNLLVNGSTGIAVGMATNIPPHNLGEVIDALLLLINDRDATMDMIMQHIKAPDFPTGGIIMGYSGVRAAYGTGRGKITLRARTEIEEKDNGTQHIIVTEIPYMVNKSRLLVSIADLVKDKRVEGISNLRDESDRQGLRIVVELKRGTNAQVVLNKLFNYTALQETVGVIMLALVGGEPKILTLKQMLEDYLDFQVEIITRRTLYDLRKAEERAHILQGFMIALDNIDEVIAILKSSKNIPEGKMRLTERFGLSDAQADAIVAMRFGQLTGMERTKIEDELAALTVKIADFKDILASEQRKLDIITEELTALKKKYNDERRTSIEFVSGEVDIEDLIEREECVVTYTNIGYIKRQTIDTFNSQRRGGRGVSGMKQRDEDFVESMFISSSHDNVLFITNMGNMYKLKCYEIPEGSKQSRGVNIVNLLQTGEDETVQTMIKTSDFDDGKFIIFVTKNGIIKRTKLQDYKNVRKKGIRAITLSEGDEIAGVFITEGDSHFIIATRNGRAIRIDETTVRSLGRTARGVRGIKLRDNDYVVGTAKVYDESMTILTVSDKGLGRRAALTSYRLQKRGGYGLLNYKVSEEKGFVCGIRAVNDEDDVILINSDGVIIRIRVSDTRVMGRYATGVRVMKLAEGSWVVGFNRTEHDDSVDVEEVEQASDEEIAAALAEEQSEVFEETDDADAGDIDDTDDTGEDNESGK